MKYTTLLSYSSTFLVSLVVSSLSFATQQWQSLQEIEQAAKTYLMSQVAEDFEDISVSIGKLDERLRLAPCEYPLHSFSPHESAGVGNTTVAVECTGEKPWTLYLSAKVHANKNVIVFKAPLPANTFIERHHIDFKTVDVSQLRQGAYENVEKLIGMQTRYPVRSNEVATPNRVMQPKLVKHGEKVTILSDRRGIKVKMSGTALSDGVKGDRIRVRNHSSNRIIEGLVQQNNLVVVSY